MHDACTRCKMRMCPQHIFISRNNAVDLLQVCVAQSIPSKFDMLLIISEFIHRVLTFYTPILWLVFIHSCIGLPREYMF